MMSNAEIELLIIYGFIVTMIAVLIIGAFKP